MASFVRESKFRNIEVKLDNRDKFYDQLRIFNGSIEGCNLLATNSKYLAYIDATGSGTALGLLPLTSVGKVHGAAGSQLPLIRAHAQAIQDFSFDKFNTSLLHTCSSDGRLKSWFIPSDGLVADISDPVAMISPRSGFSLKGICQHPSAKGVIAVRGSKDIALIDLEANEEICATSSGVFRNDVQNLAWSYSGHVLVAMAKDKVLRLFDLRLPPEEQIIATANSHTGTRTTSCVWLGDTSYFLTTGHSMMMDREMMIWDERKLDKPLKKERLDGSTSSIMPFFDSDNNLLMFCGKGESMVRIYETSIAGELFSLSTTSLGDVFRGAALLPKQAYDLMGCEVLRLLKLSDSSIQPVSVVVPRKEKRKFHDDLYPPTVCEAPPAMSSAQFREGLNFSPERIDVEASSLDGPQAVEEVPAQAAAELAPTAMTTAQIREQATEIEKVEEMVANKIEESRTSVPRVVRSSVSYTSILKYRNMYGTENPKTQSFFNLLPQLTFSDGPLIAANHLYWAIPYQGGGGPVYVSRLDSFGKVEPGVPVLNGHKAPVLDISFSPFQPNILATASIDKSVKIWTLPEDSSISLSDVEPTMTLDQHQNTVKTCSFHPVIDSFLATSSMDQTVRLFDISAGAEVHKVEIENSGSEASYPNNLSFNYDGSLIAAACRDRVIRILDPRTSTTVLSTSTSSPLGRNLSSTWCYNAQSNAILSTSASSSGMRMIHMWDTRNMNEPLNSTAVDNGAGQLFPIFDEDTGVCFLVGKGDTILRFYEITLGAEGAVCLKSSEFQSGRDPFAGVCMLPKRACDVREVEVSRLLKLTSDSVVPISFTMPRAENLKRYFQDDIFVPTRSTTSGGTIADWLQSEESKPQPQFVSLKPDDMTLASERPVEVQSKRQSTIFREEINKQEAESKQRDEAFSRLQNLAIQRSNYHPNPSHIVKAKGEAQPVADDDHSDDGWGDD
jgi:coronin-7